jgi:hypothetical protein
MVIDCSLQGEYMSTVSLMPIGKKVRVKRELKVPIFNVLSTGMHLKEQGFILGNYRNETLILDAGTVFRIDAFSASVKDKTFPSTKITIFPESGKSGSLYIELDGLDGLSWESIDEEPKKASVPVRRIDISLKDDKINFLGCWHKAFEERYEIDNPIAVLVNPSKLTPHELEKGEFKGTVENDMGEAIVKLGKDSWAYTIRTSIKHIFKLSMIQCPSNPSIILLAATYDHSTYRLQIKEGGSYSNQPYISIADTIETPEKFIKEYLTNKHQYDTL